MLEPTLTTNPSLAAVEAFDAAVVRAMRQLAADPRTIFVGQSVRYDGARIFTTLDGVPLDKREEHPVVEDHQLGYCIGLALCGRVPVCIYPRIDFMLLAMNQLVNHLDKLPALWHKHPHIIVRTTVGRKKPLHAGPQHSQNYAPQIRAMCDTLLVSEVNTADEVEMAYDVALQRPGAYLVVENPDG